MICERCERLVGAMTIHDDDEYAPFCDSCGGIAVEWPRLGWVCMSTQKALIEVGDEGLYHPEHVSIWKRLKWASIALLLVLLAGGAAQAGECNRCTPIKGNPDVIECTLVHCIEPASMNSKDQACLSKMREAMKLVDGYIQGQWNVPTKGKTEGRPLYKFYKQQWDETMKECAQ